MNEELFEIIDAEDRVVGLARRSQCHGNPALLHRTAHVVVFHPDGRILLQKRSMSKDIQPGKWDTAVGGHLVPGEDYESAARRELAEEIGLDEETELRFLFDEQIRNCVESENVRVFSICSSGPFRAQPEEIDELRFWSWDELMAGMAEDGLFTPNLKRELARLSEEPGLNNG